MSVGLRVATNNIIEIRNAQGKLVLREEEQELLKHPLYHKIRHRWCNKYRTSWSPRGFREGKLNLINLLFLITRGGQYGRN